MRTLLAAALLVSATLSAAQARDFRLYPGFLDRDAFVEMVTDKGLAGLGFADPGEEESALEDMCTRAAAEMREASDRALERFLVLFQPLMIVVVGALVGVSLSALFSALLSVHQVAF